MRKGQEKIINRAIKNGLSKEQIQVLSKEEHSIEKLHNMFLLFLAVDGYPADEAEKYVLSEKFQSRIFYVLWMNPKLTYEEYLKIPEQIRYDYKIMARILNLWEDSVRIPFDKYTDLCLWLTNNFTFEELSTWAVSGYIANNRSIDDAEFLKYAISIDIAAYNYAKNNKKNELEQFALNYAVSPENIVAIYLYKVVGEFVYLSSCFKKGLAVEECLPYVFKDKIWKEETEEFYTAIRALPKDNISYTFDTPEETEEYERLLNTSSKLDITIQCPNAYKISISLPLGDGYDAMVAYGKPAYINVYAGKGIHLHDGETKFIFSKTKYTLILNNDGRIYRKYYSKTVPATIQDVFKIMYYGKFEELNNVIWNIPSVKKSPVIKDLYSEYCAALDNGIILPPIKWNNCIGYCNKNHLMKSIYKTGKKINWNKLGVARGYAILVSNSYLNDRSKDILYNAVTNKEIIGIPYNEFGYRNAKYKTIAICSQWLIPRINISKRHHEQIQNDSGFVAREVRDYVHVMSLAGKIDLKQRSLTKIMDVLTGAEIAQREAMTPKIVIPKQTVFKKLTTNLPKEFRWIKTRRAIVEEGYYMHHCVASYADKVNADRCAIYHLEYEDRSYTIEFCKKRNGDYYVEQIQSMCDRGAPYEVRQYVNDIITTINRAG